MMTPQDQWLFQKQRILAWLRLGFAIVAVTVVQFNPARVARFPLLSYISLGSFLIYSLAVLYFTARTKAGARNVGLATTCFDLLWVSLIVFSTGGAATPFFVYYFFPVITAGSSYGIKGGVSAAFAGVGLYGFIRFNFEWEDLLGIDRFVVRSVYLVVLSYIFGFLSEFEKKQNQKLLALSKTAAEVATLDERRRISRELHDGLLQSLATHILRIETCRRHFLDSPGELERELRSMETDTRSSMKVIRQFLNGEETRPFPPGMLLEKLKDDLKFLRDGLGLHVILETELEDLIVPDTVEQDVYYLLREGLMNICRHSQASRAVVSLNYAPGVIRGAVTDNGVGFDVAQMGKTNGLGLASMKQRVARRDGKLQIHSAPGEGSTISFVLPLAPAIGIGVDADAPSTAGRA